MGQISISSSVIARSEANEAIQGQGKIARAALDCFASLTMTEVMIRPNFKSSYGSASTGSGVLAVPIAPVR
jgi:hypothetical protein